MLDESVLPILRRDKRLLHSLVVITSLLIEHFDSCPDSCLQSLYLGSCFEKK